MNKGLKVAGLVVAGVVAMTACKGGATETVYYKNGPAGTIKEKEIEDGNYELDVITVKGKKKEFNVTSSVYFDCAVGAYYPSCVKSAKTNVKPTPTKSKKNTSSIIKDDKKKSTKKDDKKTETKSSGFGSSSGKKTK